MAIFKSEGVILKVQKYSEKEFLYKVFFLEYGILHVKKKKNAREKALDIGYRMSSEIFTKEGSTLHTISSIKVLGFFGDFQKKYSEIEIFMKIIAYIIKELPQGYPNRDIYKVLIQALEYNTEKVEQKLLLSYLKIFAINGDLTEDHNNITTQRILRYIHKHNIDTLNKLGDIPQDSYKDLKDLVKA